MLSPKLSWTRVRLPPPPPHFHAPANGGSRTQGGRGKHSPASISNLGGNSLAEGERHRGGRSPHRWGAKLLISKPAPSRGQGRGAATVRLPRLWCCSPVPSSLAHPLACRYLAPVRTQQAVTPLLADKASVYSKAKLQDNRASSTDGGRTMNDRPIGIFARGIGGLTVVRSVMDRLPDERIIYLGDGARGPYGPRDIDEVSCFAHEIIKYLLGFGVKLIVIACNS